MFIEKNKVRNIIKILYILFSFICIDIFLRVATRWLGFYSIYKCPPTMFSVCWCVIIIILLSFLPKNAGRIVYGILYFFLSGYSIVQYIYYLGFNKFLYFTDFSNASEGYEFIGFIKGIISYRVIIYLCILIFVGLCGLRIYPKFNRDGWKVIVGRFSALFAALVSIMLIPRLYILDDNPAMNAYVEYESFSSSGFDVELVGYYHYLARDCWISFLKPKPDSNEYIEVIDSFLSKKPIHNDNEFTGVLKGKNIIIVQVEALDDWLINKENTPVIYQLINEGLFFSNMYTPCYGSGWTFGTEFAFNSGVYQGAKVMAGGRLARNHFPYSIANIASSMGYSCNSYHENTGNYYNRTSMHDVLGYHYHSTTEIVAEGDSRDDTTLVSDEVWSKMRESSSPFLDFIITFSGHLPYDENDELSKYALAKYSEYNVPDRDSEINALIAKTRLTDDMFGILINKLEEDGLLNNTVIIAYADHYSYGITNKNLVKQYSIQNGSSILERTPAFLWYKGCEKKEVTKTCQTIDWLPTIVNMLGENITPYVIGNDIFDENYAGYAIFPDNAWVLGDTYVQQGIVQNDAGLNDNEINKMNSLIREFYIVNDAILQSDYYRESSTSDIYN